MTAHLFKSHVIKFPNFIAKNIAIAILLLLLFQWHSLLYDSSMNVLSRIFNSSWTQTETFLLHLSKQFLPLYRLDNMHSNRAINFQIRLWLCCCWSDSSLSYYLHAFTKYRDPFLMLSTIILTLPVLIFFVFFHSPVQHKLVILRSCITIKLHIHITMNSLSPNLTSHTHMNTRNTQNLLGLILTTLFNIHTEILCAYILCRPVEYFVT